jgi:peptidoglycan/LPS O-acetylase OafA/YrhL
LDSGGGVLRSRQNTANPVQIDVTVGARPAVTASIAKHPAEAKKERLYSLDAARAIAALAVVLQHWPEHFFSLERFSAATEDSPLFFLFAPFYERGARAVTFFFCLSGFIFYWLYSRKVHDRIVGPSTFAMLRLSRLYPLHLATLLLCVVLQWPLIQMLGHPFIYQQHDVYHFLLNLPLIQYWGFESGWSFNGPSWSISVEIFLYFAFFAACWFARPSLWQCLALAFAALLVARYSVLADAAATFFLGGASFHVYRTLSARWTPLKSFVLVAIVVGLWALIPPLTQPDILQDRLAQLRPWLGEGRLGDIVETGVLEFAQRQFEFVLFPATVATLALSEIVWKRIPWVWLHELGNMSYGIYLLHFPLQLAFVSIALTFGFPSDFFTRITTLALFVGLLLVISFASYRVFERPAMLAIRRAWLRRPDPGLA